MLRNAMVLIAAASLAAGCAARPRLVRNDSIDQLEAVAAAGLRCSDEELEVVPLTLFTTVVRGCDRQAVYAYDWMSDGWILDESGIDSAALPGPWSAGRSSGDEFRGPHR
jgi:hypothetical protein